LEYILVFAVVAHLLAKLTNQNISNHTYIYTSSNSMCKITSPVKRERDEALAEQSESEVQTSTATS